VDVLKSDLHLLWSLRTVRRLLHRVNDFAGFQPSGNSLPDSVSAISVTDVALSFLLILPPKSFDETRQNRIIANIIHFFGGQRTASTGFVKGPTRYFESCQYYSLIRGHVALPMPEPADFPRPFLDTLFWAG
jgi:hypothetical protein